MNKQDKHIYTSPYAGNRRKKEKVYNMLIAVFITLFILGAAGLMIVSRNMRNEKKQLQQLAGLVAENRHTTTESAQDDRLQRYRQLHRQNRDFFGWIEIEGTDVNYPVMHTPDYPEKYLRADFDGNYSFSGLPFLDRRCTEDSDNMLVYGHNMIDGGMFTDIAKYKDERYWQSHPVIKFDTLYNQYEYEVMYAFYDRVYNSDEDVFKFYQFVDADDAQSFTQAIDSLSRKSLYNTGVTAEYGDSLLTLVTCGYHTTNGRFVVVTRRK